MTMLVASTSMAEGALDLAITPTEYIVGTAHLKSLEQLAAELAKLTPKELHIKPEQGVAYDRVAGALKVVQKQGNISIGLVGYEKAQ